MKFFVFLWIAFTLSWSSPTESSQLLSEFDLSTPRATLKAYFDCMREWSTGGKEKVYELFEIFTPETEARQQEGIFYSQLLKDILDRTAIIQYDTLPTDSTLRSYVLMNFKEGPIRLRRDAHGQFRFSESTLQRLDDIYARIFQQPLLNGAIEIEMSPPLKVRQYLLRYPLLNKETLGIKNWQWILLIPLIVIATLLYGLIHIATPLLLKRLFAQYENVRTLKIGKPLGLIAGSGLLVVSLKGLVLHNNNFLFGALTVAFHGVFYYSVLWFLWGAINGLIHLFEIKAQKTESKFDDLLVPMFRTALRIVLGILAVFMGSKIFHYDVTHLIAGLGIGSLAVALAAKDTIENLFGSVTVVIDRPFHIGDWVVIGDTEGTVEKLGFRSTRIRTFYDSQVSVPNSKLISAVVDNMGQRVYRRIKTYLSLTYQTPPDKISAFCEGIRELIRQHPYTRKDYYHVYFNQFNASSLDVLLYCFLQVEDWAMELRERERLFLDIIRLAEELGVEFAYPTQTLFMQHIESSTEKASLNAVASAAEFARQLSQKHFEKGQAPRRVKYE